MTFVLQQRFKIMLELPRDNVCLAIKQRNFLKSSVSASVARQIFSPRSNW